MPLKARGEFALVRQNLEAALQTAGQPVSWGTMAHDHEMYMMLADIAVQLRDVRALQKYAPLLEELARRDDHKFYLAVAQRAWGVAHRLAGEHSKSEARLKASLEFFRALGARWQTGRTLAELGHLDLSRSKAKAARAYFSQALAAFEEIQAVTDADQIRPLLNG